MLNLLRLFAPAEEPVLSLAAQVRLSAKTLARRSQFGLLVRHLLDRFFNNDLITVGGETLPLLMTVAGVIAVPTFIVTILLFPAYHAFPPKPPVPGFWEQAGVHYFFVMYSFVAMGCVTIFEADLLFPNLLDIFILSPLPIANRRLVLARVSAVVLFLVLFLLGVNSLGIVAFPLMAGPFSHYGRVTATEINVPRLFVAHLTAVCAAGTFVAALFLALQGVLIAVLNGRVYRAVSAALQGVSIAVLLSVLFSFLAVFRSLAVLIQSGAGVVRYFPPFWFLGMYECILAGPARLPVFARLAQMGVRATGLSLLVAVVTYPLAYRRRTRQAIEGTVVRSGRSGLAELARRGLHATVLRSPARAAVFHFIGQTLRSPRHRVYLAMYAGLGAALLFASAVVLTAGPDSVGLGLSPAGVRLAVPGLAFWVVAGLRTALTSPADPTGSWVFRVIHGRPTLEHLVAARLWVLLWATLVTLGGTAVLLALAWPELGGVREAAVQLLVGTGVCLLVADGLFLQLEAIPFTEARIPENTDLAFVLLRYIVLFPAVVLGTVASEPWIGATAGHFVAASVLLLAAHWAMGHVHRAYVARAAARHDRGEQVELIQGLGLQG